MWDNVCIGRFVEEVPIGISRDLIAETVFRNFGHSPDDYYLLCALTSPDHNTSFHKRVEGWNGKTVVVNIPPTKQITGETLNGSRMSGTIPTFAIFSSFNPFPETALRCGPSSDKRMQKIGQLPLIRSRGWQRKMSLVTADSIIETTVGHNPALINHPIIAPYLVGPGRRDGFIIDTYYNIYSKWMYPIITLLPYDSSPLVIKDIFTKASNHQFIWIHNDIWDICYV